MGYAGILLDISDFPTRHNYLLALWQSHFERILADWVEELGVPILRGCEVVGFSAGRHRRRCRAVRRHVAPSRVPRRLRRRAQPDPQGGRDRLPRVGPDDEPPDRRGRDGRGAGGRHAPRGWWHRSRQPRGGRRAVPGRAAREARRTHQRAHPAGPQRGAHRRLRDGLRGAQPDLDLPVHRHDPAGGVLPRGTRAARRRRRACAWPARWTGPQHGRAGCRESGLEARPGDRQGISREPPGHLPRRTASGRCPGVAQHHGAGRAQPHRRAQQGPSRHHDRTAEHGRAAQAHRRDDLRSRHPLRPRRGTPAARAAHARPRLADRGRSHARLHPAARRQTRAPQPR